MIAAAVYRCAAIRQTTSLTVRVPMPVSLQIDAFHKAQSQKMLQARSYTRRSTSNLAIRLG